jgi:hypothetical protein
MDGRGKWVTRTTKGSGRPRAPIRRALPGACHRHRPQGPAGVAHHHGSPVSFIVPAGLNPPKRKVRPQRRQNMALRGIEPRTFSEQLNSADCEREIITIRT